jgi:hypothetical protein
MAKLYKAITFVIIINLLSGCAGLSVTERESIRTIGLLNSFPDNPTWTVIGTTIFTNQLSTAPPRGYKSLLNQITIDYLKSRGYKVKELSDKNSVQDADVNFRIELSPRDAEQYVDTKGYGFVQRSFFGMKKGPFAYVVMYIIPRFRGDSGFGTFGKYAYYHEQFEPLTIDEMPPTWNDLLSATQDDLEKSLKICIEKSLNEQLPKLGL